ncbi:efflux RND transporter periplasmic adaptor subunit [Crocosphaera sp.]|uniref:efflux RND transporter periplasmic adaptor subunit n=1 Tax=Crocosphaera sp. TaxID=2729996 RepID=UPI002579C44D|nr:efflux RND transporter periplasmic adaptor subunit [Crocosphaera sp.]
MSKVWHESDFSANLFFITAKKMNFRNVLLTTIMGGGLILVGFMVGSQYRPQEETQVKTPYATSPNVLRVKTLKITPISRYSTQRTYIGETATMRESSLGFERGGKVVQVYIEEGDRVTKGQIIAKLDTSDLETQKLDLEAQQSQQLAVLAELTAGERKERIDAARAKVQQLQERLSLEVAKRERREYLYQEGAISLEQLDEVSFNSNVLAAQLAEAQSLLDELLAGTRIEQIDKQKAVIKQMDAKIEQINLDITKSNLKSPYSGTIAQQLIDEGTVVSIGESIVKLVEDGKLEVRIGIPVDKISTIRRKSQYSVLINNKQYGAKLSAILPEVDAATRTQTIILNLESSAGFRVPQGAIARLNVNETIAQSGFWLPTTALIKGDRGLWSCYVVIEGENGTQIVEKRDIEILYTESSRILVRGTINPGDRVITQGTQRVVPGQIVISE